MRRCCTPRSGGAVPVELWAPARIVGGRNGDAFLAKRRESKDDATSEKRRDIHSDCPWRRF